MAVLKGQFGVAADLATSGALIVQHIPEKIAGQVATPDTDPGPYRHNTFDDESEVAE
jgi:hypothetical protein